MDKTGLKKQLAKEWKTHYDLKIFKEHGFERKTCKNCGKGFWTKDADRQLCSDSSCEPYGFIGNPSAKKFDYVQMWEALRDFFKKNQHEDIPRYPVICRWRNDLYFTIASIVDFQRFDNNTLTFNYPADKLIVPQVCLRFGDIPNIGVTGKHLSCFVMPGQHAFGYPDTGYWKEGCISYNYDFLTKVMKIPEKDLVYVEDAWAMADMSAFGPSIETYSKGLEIANSVFMQYTLKDKKVEEFPLKVIDVGWGLERLTWLSNGTPTAYDCVFGDMTHKMIKQAGLKYDKQFFLEYSKIAGALDVVEAEVKQEREKIAKKLKVDFNELLALVEPIQALYAIADHSRALAFAITDGGLPSNSGGGYNLRVLLRRALSFMVRFGFPFELNSIIKMHADYLKPMFPEIKQNLPEIEEIIKFEEKKYEETLKKSRSFVTNLVKKKHSLTVDELSKLYESQGITPELIEEVSGKLNKKIEMPIDFYTKMTEKHEAFKEEEKKEEFDVSKTLKTEILYYDDVFSFKASIIASVEKGDKSLVVLDKTAFYPTSGGQDSDRGLLNGQTVTRVFKVGEVIVHEIEGKIKGPVEGMVDENRRKQLMRHHTATHIINGSARELLGNHIWQAGSEKTVDKARLDVTHYDILSPQQIAKIEKRANEIVSEGRKVIKEVLPRNVAEKKYGFRLYQGGAVPAKELRIINIENFDFEACGGIHVDNTKEIGPIKIINSFKKQDGIIRLEFVAGKELIDRYAKKHKEEIEKDKSDWVRECVQCEEELNNLKAKLGLKTTKEKLGALDTEALIDKWKKLRKETEKARQKAATKIEVKDKVQYVEKADMKILQNIGRKIVAEDQSACVVLVSDGIVFGIKGKKCKEDIEKAVKAAASVMGGSAGGKDEIKGGGPLKEKSVEAYEKAKKMLK